MDKVRKNGKDIRFLTKGKPKIYQRLVIIFLVLILPSYLISFVITRRAVQHIETSVSSAIKTNVDFYSTLLNYQLSQVQTQQIALLHNTDIQQISVYKTYENFNIVTKIESLMLHMAAIKNTSNLISDIGVYFNESDKTISASYGLRRKANVYSREIEGFLSESTNASWNTRNTKNEVIFFRAPNFNYKLKGSLPAYITFFSMNHDYLRSTLKSIKYSQDGIAILVVGQEIIEATASPDLDLNTAIKSYDKLDQEEGRSRVMNLNGNKMLAVASNVVLGPVKIYLFEPQDKVNVIIKNYNTWYTLFLSISCVLIFTFAMTMSRTLHNPFRRLRKSIEAYMTGSSKSFMTQYDETEEFSYLYKSFNEMVEEIDDYISEAYEQKLVAQQMELKQLQSQINPHFLYNCFYTIYRLTKSEDYETLAHLSSQLGGYYEYITRSGNDWVELSREYEHVLKYIGIQSIRFVNRIEITLQPLPDHVGNRVVPRLFLQPLVENAIEHGFSKKKNGVINIESSFCDDVFIFKVEDSGDGMADEDLKAFQTILMNPQQSLEKTGLLNISRRLKLKYGSQSGIYLEANELGGLTSKLIIYFTSGRIQMEGQEVN